MNVENFDKLIDFLDNLEPSKFYFDDVVSKYDKDNECGTVCCAIGWTPAIFPEKVEWYYLSVKAIDDKYEGYIGVSSDLFDIDELVTQGLFCSKEQRTVHSSLNNLSPYCTPKELATELKKFKELVLDGVLNEDGTEKEG